MLEKLPVISVQCDWNDVIRLPQCQAWISAKYRNENSSHGTLTTSINNADGKIKITVPEEYQYVSHSNLNLILKHIASDLKVVFVAPSKVHKVHSKAVLSVAASDKMLTASSCEEDKLLVWDGRTSEIMLDLKGHGGPVYKCLFFPSGIVILSGGADGSCRIWSAESGINPVTLAGHSMAVADICIIDKGRNVISVSRDGTAKLWDVGESRCLDNIIEGHGPINCCDVGITSDVADVEDEREIGTGNKLVVVGCESGLVVCAHVAKRQEVFRRDFGSAINACAVLDKYAVVGCNDGKVVQFKIEDGSIIRDWDESASPVLSVVSLQDHIFAVGRQDGSCTVLSLVDSHTRVRVQLTGSDCDGIRDIAFNGKWIFTACRDSNVRKYDYNQVIVHYK